MATVLHLLKTFPPPLAAAAIQRQVGAGDRVALAVLGGAPHPGPLDGVQVLRVPDEVSYGELLDLVFAADQVIAW